MPILTGSTLSIIQSVINLPAILIIIIVFNFSLMLLLLSPMLPIFAIRNGRRSSRGQRVHARKLMLHPIGCASLNALPRRRLYSIQAVLRSSIRAGYAALDGHEPADYSAVRVRQLVLVLRQLFFDIPLD